MPCNVRLARSVSSPNPGICPSCRNRCPSGCRSAPMFAVSADVLQHDLILSIKSQQPGCVRRRRHPSAACSCRCLPCRLTRWSQPARYHCGNANIVTAIFVSMLSRCQQGVASHSVQGSNTQIVLPSREHSLGDDGDQCFAQWHQHGVQSCRLKTSRKLDVQGQKLKSTHSAAPATSASPTGISAALNISPGVMSLRLALCATAK